MKLYQTVGLLMALGLGGCQESSEEKLPLLPRQQEMAQLSLRNSPRRSGEREQSLSRSTIDRCGISFAGYTGMCEGKTFGGQTVLVREYDKGRFDFFFDEDNDNCFDEKGRGFYMDGLSRRTDVHNLEPKKYCLR